MIRTQSLRFGAALVVGLATLSGTGCGGSKVNLSNYDKVTIGMTEADVEAILGKGEEKASAGVGLPGNPLNIPGGGLPMPNLGASLKMKMWQDGQKNITITFMDGKVMGKVQSGL